MYQQINELCVYTLSLVFLILILLLSFNEKTISISSNSVRKSLGMN